jgi:hypothetical protein
MTDPKRAKEYVTISNLLLLHLDKSIQGDERHRILEEILQSNKKDRDIWGPIEKVHEDARYLINTERIKSDMPNITDEELVGAIKLYLSDEEEINEYTSALRTVHERRIGIDKFPPLFSETK